MNQIKHTICAVVEVAVLLLNCCWSGWSQPLVAASSAMLLLKEAAMTLSLLYEVLLFEGDEDLKEARLMGEESSDCDFLFVIMSLSPWGSVLGNLLVAQL